jgi:hypothetical protein
MSPTVDPRQGLSQIHEIQTKQLEIQLHVMSLLRMYWKAVIEKSIDSQCHIAIAMEFLQPYPSMIAFDRTPWPLRRQILGLTCWSRRLPTESRPTPCESLSQEMSRELRENALSRCAYPMILVKTPMSVPHRGSRPLSPHIEL